MLLLTTSREYLPVQWSALVELDDQAVEIGIQLEGETEADRLWYTAAWTGAASTTRVAQIMVGPGGDPSVGELPATSESGVHGIYTRLTDTPEIPVQYAYGLVVR